MPRAATHQYTPASCLPRQGGRCQSRGSSAQCLLASLGQVQILFVKRAKLGRQGKMERDSMLHSKNGEFPFKCSWYNLCAEGCASPLDSLKSLKSTGGLCPG